VAITITTRSSFIKQFHAQEGNSKIVCFKFWELVSAAGCPYSCSYCFLQATPSYVFKHYPLHGAIFSNWKQMLEEVDIWLKHPIPRMLVIGELQDGLAFDSIYKKQFGIALTEMLIPKFAKQNRHQLLFLSKSIYIKNVLNLQPTNQVIFSWSVNAEDAAKRWEKGAPSPYKRFDAAKKIKEKGWRIRFRLDPMIPYEGWQEGYLWTIKQINDLEPEMVTIGSLRASNTLGSHAKKNGRDASIFDLLTEKDPSGFKNRLPLAIHSKLFAFALKHLKSSTKPALCKEDLSLWKSLGLAFNGCHCLLDSNDGLIIPRQYLVDQLSEKTLIATMQSGRYLHRLHIKQRRQP